jgi:hypothetical protein
MQIPTEQLIDVALNIAGYLAAGGFWLVIYSAWQNRKRRTVEGIATDSPDSAASRPATVAAAAAAGGEFVNFRDRQASDKAAEERGSGDSGTNRRNRAEVFALARTMLSKGVSSDMIKRTVPISDGELAILAGK